MLEHNHTPWALVMIRTFPYLGRTVNTWRQRDITLYAHPDDPASLISVGDSTVQHMRVIAIEPRSAWTTALDYAARNMVYVSS